MEIESTQVNNQNNQIYEEQQNFNIIQLSKQENNDINITNDKGFAQIINLSSQFENNIRIYENVLQDIEWVTSTQILTLSQFDADLFDIPTQKFIRNFGDSESELITFKSMPFSNIFITAGKDKLLKFWDLRDPHLINCCLCYGGDVFSLDFSHNQQSFAGSSADGYCRVISLYTYKLMKTLMVNSKVPHTSIQFSNNDKYLLISSMNNMVSLWDWNNSEMVKNFTEHENLNYVIPSFLGYLNGKQQLIVTGSENGKMFIYHIKDGTLYNTQVVQSGTTEKIG